MTILQSEANLCANQDPFIITAISPKVTTQSMLHWMALSDTPTMDYHKVYTHKSANGSSRVKIGRTEVIASVMDFKINTLLYVSSDFSVQFSAPDLMKGINVIRANRRTGHEADLIIDEHAFELSCSPFMFVLLILLVDIRNFKEEAEEHLQDAILENFAAFGDVCLGMGGRRHSVHLLLKVVVMQSVLELEAAQGGCCAKCIGTRSGFKARRVGIYKLNKKSPNVNTESSAVKKSKAPMSNTEADSPSLKKKDKHRKGLKTSFDATKGAGEGPSGTNKTTADGVEKKKQEVGRGFLNEPLLRPVAPTSGSPLVDHMNNEPLLRPVAPTSSSPLVDHMNQMRQYCQDRMAAQAPQVAQVAAKFKKVATDSCRFPSWTQGMSNATNQCSFSGMPLQTDSDPMGIIIILVVIIGRDMVWIIMALVLYSIGVFGMMVVEFIRLQDLATSRKKDDYDLCGVCFARMGTASDYVRIDHPMHVFRHHVPFKGFYDPYMADDHPQNEPWHGVDHVELKCTPDLSKQQCGDCLNEAVSVYMTRKCGVSRLENISSHV
ncbi:hypothetical protein Tco_0364917 [Tanacetum coccineum]